jgi:hypothetical protein
MLLPSVWCALDEYTKSMPARKKWHTAGSKSYPTSPNLGTHPHIENATLAITAQMPWRHCVAVPTSEVVEHLPAELLHWTGDAPLVPS